MDEYHLNDEKQMADYYESEFAELNFQLRMSCVDPEYSFEDLKLELDNPDF